MGQSVLLQIDVDGSDSPDAPDLSPLAAGFAIQDAGGGARRSQSVSVINGQWNRTVERGYSFRYQLSPRREGTLTIPAITITVDGNSVSTQPISIRVIPPTEVRDFKLRSILSETSAFVGQPILLRTTWYLSRNVDQIVFGMPLLDDDRFEILDLPVDRSDPSDEYIDLVVNNRIITAKQDLGRLDGREYLTVSFAKVVIPREPGRFEIPSTTASFRTRTVVQGRSTGFGGFLGGMMSRRTEIENLAIPSNRPLLEVSALPMQGRPANFSGLVGAFTLAATADPVDVRVGDPINLQISVGGPDYVDYVRLPHLSSNHALADGFVIPEERPQGVVRGDAKVFQQAVRAKTVDVTEVPPLQLNYFDPESRSYAVARTAPIPIAVEATRMLTSADLGDLGLPAVGDRTDQPELAGNHEDLAALSVPGSGLYWAALSMPPVLFGLLLVATRRKDVESGSSVNAEAQAALRHLESLAGANADDISRALREFLSAKFGVPAVALTYADLEPLLVHASATQELQDQLQSVFRRCDEARFAGSHSDSAALNHDALNACRAIDSLEVVS